MPSLCGPGISSSTTVQSAAITSWIYVCLSRLYFCLMDAHLLRTGIECQANQGSSTTEECTVAWGICNVGFALATAFLHLGLTNVLPLSMHSTSTAYLAGSKPDKFVRWITETGNSRSTAGRLKIREFTQVSVCDCSF
jgi:hypothetical protein